MVFIFFKVMESVPFSKLLLVEPCYFRNPGIELKGTDSFRCWYLLTCMRYIELNPVRAHKLAAHPSEYPWSSYRFNALGYNEKRITPQLEFTRLRQNWSVR